MKALLMAVLVLMPQTESSEFTISLNGQRIGTEAFSVIRSGGGFVATGRTQLRVAGETVVAESRMEMDENLNPSSYRYRSGDRTIEIDIGPEVTSVDITVGGEVTSYSVRFPPGGLIVDDNFFHHYVLLMNRVGPEGGTVEVFVPQQLTVGTLKVEPTGDRAYELSTENLTLRATTDGAGRLVRLTGVEANVVVER